MSVKLEGSTNFRKEIFQKSKTHITTFVNNLGWLFDGVDGIRISILCVEKRKKRELQKETIYTQGPFKSFEEFKYGKNKNPIVFIKEQIFSWTDTASLPSLPREDSLDVFLQLRKTPRLDLNDKNSWRVRPDRELDATAQKPLFDLESKKCPNGFWPVFKGESFNIWEQDTGKYYTYAEYEKVVNWLYKKRLNSYKKKSSVYSEFPIHHIKDKQTLSCFKSRDCFS